MIVLADADGFIWVESELTDVRARALVKQYLAMGIYLTPLAVKVAA